MGKQPFAITRSEKIKTWAQLSKSVGHTMRTSMDPRQHLADVAEPLRVLAGSPDFVKGWKEQVEGMHLRKLQQGASHTLVREFFFGMSPEWAVGKTRAEIDAWAEANVEWVKTRFGEERLALAVAHFDEQTPHLAVYLKPLTKDPKARGNGWTLSDRALGLGGSKDALTKLQDDYAAAMEPFGLRRGIKGSKATHQKTSEWRRQMAKPLDEPVVKPRTPKPGLAEAKEAYGQRVADHMAKAIFDQMKPYQQQAKAQAKKLGEQANELAAMRVAMERLHAMAQTLAMLFELLVGKPVNVNDPKATAEALAEAHATIEATRAMKRAAKAAPPEAAPASPSTPGEGATATAAPARPDAPKGKKIKA